MAVQCHILFLILKIFCLLYTILHYLTTEKMKSCAVGKNSASVQEIVKFI